MLDNFSYLLIIAGIIIAWFVIHYLYKIYSREAIQTFLDSQNTIIIISTIDSVKMINETGLKVFGFKSLKSFLLSKSALVDAFVETEGYLDKYTYGQKWIEKVFEKERNQSVKVKIFSKEDALYRYYQLRISKLKGSKAYILNFMDISDIERSRMLLQESAEHDALTKIYNRVKLNELFESLFFNANKYNLNLSVILFDIDHFKKINDTYGHNVGDKVLVELSRLAKGVLRTNDLLARWGGEEFIIVLNETSLEHAIALAMRLKNEIDKYPFDVVKHVTCSFGVTDFSAGDTQTKFLERVDEALYEAKDQGRNCVVTKRRS